MNIYCILEVGLTKRQSLLPSTEMTHNDFDNEFDYYFDKQIRLKGGFGRPHLTITVSMFSSNIIINIKLSYEGQLLYLKNDRVFLINLKVR